MGYEPELGQMAFGQPWQQHDCTQNVQSVLTSLSNAWDVLRRDDNPFNNTGARFDGRMFKAYAYDWGDDEQPFNFAWRDVRVSWYKYLCRGMSMNRSVSDVEAADMLRDCMGELLSGTERV